MLIQVNYGDVERSDAINDFVHEKVTKELGHLADKLTRVEVHLRDDNSSAKSSHNDKRCTMEARPAGRKPLVVEHAGDDLYKVITETAGTHNCGGNNHQGNHQQRFELLLQQ